MVGGSKLKKNVLVVLPYRQVNAFLNRALIEYNFPTGLRPILRFFLKSSNAK